MCIMPLQIHLDRHETIMAQCRKCEQCIAARKRHWIGRLNAEEQTADTVWFTTLTYGGGYENSEAYWLDYSHVQKMFKRLRKAGHKFKYLCVGEYGGERSRAHWHVIFYWQTPPPEVKMDEQIDWSYWDEGVSQIEYPRSNQAAAAYIMDYLSKDNLSKNLLKYSKNPCLGESYLLDYARERATEGLGIFGDGDRYTIPNNLNSAGEAFWYSVGRQTALYNRMFDAYLLEWALVRPTQKLPLNEEMLAYVEELLQLDDLPPRLEKYFELIYDQGPHEPTWEATAITTVSAQLVLEVTQHHMQLIHTNPKGETKWRVLVDERKRQEIKHGLPSKLLLEHLNDLFEKRHMQQPVASKATTSKNCPLWTTRDVLLNPPLLSPLPTTTLSKRRTKNQKPNLGP